MPYFRLLSDKPSPSSPPLPHCPALSHPLAPQLANAEEFIDDQSTGELGEILIRCNNVLWIRGLNE